MDLENIPEPSSNVYFKNIPECLWYYILLAIQLTVKYILVMVTYLTDLKLLYARSSKFVADCFTYGNLKKDIVSFRKLPRHMSYVVNEDVGPKIYDDLANLVVWTIAFGIPYISLYDRQGILKSGESRLQAVIKEKVNLLFGSKAKDFDIVVKDSSTLYENGITYPRRVCIQLLSEEDGKPNILQAAKQIALDYCEKKIKLNDINIDYVDKSIDATRNIPDPDLIIQFGPISSLLGFLPWQTRLSEILHAPTVSKISYSRFHGFLEKFSKCNQRFGR